LKFYDILHEQLAKLRIKSKIGSGFIVILLNGMLFSIGVPDDSIASVAFHASVDPVVPRKDMDYLIHFFMGWTEK